MPNLKHFVGKICTIFTVPINRDYQKENPETYPQQLHAYFMGVVESVDQHGIMLTQLLTGKKSFFYHSAIVGIAEEELMDPNDPANKKVIEEMTAAKEVERRLVERRLSEQVAVNTKDQPLIDIDRFESLMRPNDSVADPQQ
jgi:hypothetical protein